MASKKTVRTNKTAVIYARYSSDSQREESIEDQLRECIKFAKSKGYKIVGEYFDKALTGRSDKRPEFQKMVKDSENGLFDYVICYKTDRFARSRNDASKYKNILKNNGVKVVYAKVDIPIGPEGIILEGVLEALDEYYSANLSQNIRRGQNGNALKCMANGVYTVGYDIDASGFYIVNEFESYAVNKVFDMIMDGFGDMEIISWLNDNGYVNKKGRPFTKNAISRMVKNRKYIGEYSFGDVVIPHGMPALMTEEKFIKANEAYNNKKGKRTMNNNFILSKVLYCGECGASMFGCHGTSKSGKKHYYYTCRNNKDKKGCNKSSVKKEYIENEIIRILNTYIFNDEVLNEIADGLVKYQLERIDNSNLEYLKSQLNDKEKALNNIIAAIEKGMFNDTMIERMNTLESEKKELERKIKLEGAENEIIDKDFILFILKKFKTKELDSLENKKRLVETFVSKAFLFDDGKIVLTFNYKKNGHLATHQEVLDALDNSVRLFPIGGDGGSRTRVQKAPHVKTSTA